MWNNTRELIRNSIPSFGQIFRRDGDSQLASDETDFRRRPTRRSRCSNRNNCLSRSSTRASNINSQLHRELLNSPSSSPSSSGTQIIPIRPPHSHRALRSTQSSNQCSSIPPHACFTPLPTLQINLSTSNQSASLLPPQHRLSNTSSPTVTASALLSSSLSLQPPPSFALPALSPLSPLPPPPPAPPTTTFTSTLTSNLPSTSSVPLPLPPPPPPQLLPAPETTSLQPPLPLTASSGPSRSLSPILPVANSRYPIIGCPQYTNVFNQHYLRSISRSFCNLTGGDLHPFALKKEKNYLSCLINLLVIVTIVIAIFQPKWFSISGGACNNRYIGLNEFMYIQNPPLPPSPFRNPSSSNQMWIYDHNKVSSTTSTFNTHDDQTSQHKPKKVNYLKHSDILTKNDRENDHKALTTTSTKINLNGSDYRPVNTINSISSHDHNDTKIHKGDQLANRYVNNLNHHLSFDGSNNQTSSNTQEITHSAQSSLEKDGTNQNQVHRNKVKKSIAYDGTGKSSEFQFYRNLADHFQNRFHNDCLSPEVLSLQRLIIILCIFVIFSTVLQLLLDLISTSNKYMVLLREHAIFNIISVIICIMVIGISYLLSNLLTKEQIQKHHSMNRLYNYQAKSSMNYFDPEEHIEVKLEISYYLVIFAGIFSLMASFLECNLFFNKPNLYLININNDQHETSNLLNEDSQGYWSHLFLNNQLRNSINYCPPPPYTP